MRWLMSHPWLKLVSLVLAVLTWVFVRSITSETRPVNNVPLEIRVKAGFTLLQSSVTAVNVVLSGTREDVRQASRSELSAVLDLSREDKTGQWSVPLGPRLVRHPPWVQVVEIEPALVTVHVDRLMEQEVKVVPQLSGELPAGFVVESAVVRPQMVPVRGPKLLLDEMKTLETLPIDVTGRRSSFRERVDLALPDPSVLPTKRRWVEVDVRIAEGRPVDSGNGAGVQGTP